ncbi:MAG: hypothetical protein KGL42_10270 [Betaproteobacteria bacterium]|nr:hypothetical protein [Betaproteobacteria bacterium]
MSTAVEINPTIRLEFIIRLEFEGYSILAQGDTQGPINVVMLALNCTIQTVVRKHPEAGSLSPRAWDAAALFIDALDSDHGLGNHSAVDK